MKQKNIWTNGLAALLFSGVVVPAVATTTIWGTPTTANCSSGTTLNATCSVTSSGGLTLTYSAISDTGSGGNILGAYVGAYAGGLGVTSRAGTNTAAVTGVGGSAAGTQEAPINNNDSMDNSGNYEMLLLTFTDTVTHVATAVNLGALNINGYAGVDSDLTVLAWGGTGSPNVVNTQYSSLLSAGWQLVGNYANVASNTATPVNPNSRSSSYWLIGAYNSTFGGGANLDGGNDFARLLSVSTSIIPTGPGSTPEPSSLVLAAIALLGLGVLRRQRGLGV